MCHDRCGDENNGGGGFKCLVDNTGTADMVIDMARNHGGRLADSID
jgi:hypothetical protein